MYAYVVVRTASRPANPAQDIFMVVVPDGDADWLVPGLRALPALFDVVEVVRKPAPPEPELEAAAADPEPSAPETSAPPDLPAWLEQLPDAAELPELGEERPAT